MASVKQNLLNGSVKDSLFDLDILLDGIKDSRRQKRDQHQKMQLEIAKTKSLVADLEDELAHSKEWYNKSAESKAYAFSKALRHYITKRPEIVADMPPLVLFDPTESPEYNSIDILNLVSVKSVNYDNQTLEFTDKKVQDIWNTVAHLFILREGDSEHHLIYDGRDKKQIDAVVSDVATKRRTWQKVIIQDEWKTDLDNSRDDEFGIFSSSAPSPLLVQPMTKCNTLRFFEKQDCIISTFGLCKTNDCCHKGQHIFDENGNPHIFATLRLVVLHLK